MKTTNDNITEDFNLPKDKEYVFCFLSECPAAKKCTRFFATQFTGDRDMGLVVFPGAMKNGKCKWYKKLRKIRGAWGFKKIFEDAKAKDAPALRQEIKDYLGGNGTYYLYQHGDKLLTPEQQSWIISLFKRYGYTDNLEFDGYRDVYDW